MSRYIRRTTATNDEEQYNKMFKDRGVSQIEQHRTPEFVAVEKETLEEIETQSHYWSMGDTYWKLSSVYYGSPEHWWIIASFNRRPTEAHNKIGDKIKIPINLSEALQVVY